MPITSTELVAQEEEMSGEVQELISYKPRWIIRYGNGFLFLILVCLLVAMSFINYPDIIKGSIRLSALNAPKLLIARTDGALQKLLVHNEQFVSNGQPLAFIQSTAEHSQVLVLQQLMGSIEPYIVKDSFGILPFTEWSDFDQLGEIQSDYQTFQNSLKETLQILQNGYYQHRKIALQRDLSYLSSLRSNTIEQQKLLQQDYELQLTEYAANETLAKDTIISPLELHQSKSKVIGKEQNLQQISSQLVTNQLSEQDKIKEIQALDKYFLDQEQNFRSAFFTLKSKIDEWVRKYVVVAPENGKVFFTTFLQKNQLLSNGEELFYIQPEQSEYYGQMMMSQNGFGKIKLGQTVIVRVESYPSNEFGYLIGKVGYISSMPNSNDSFAIKVDFHNGLHTNYNKNISFRNSLSGQGEIITDNRKLIDRILGQIKVVTKR